MTTLTMKHWFGRLAALLPLLFLFGMSGCTSSRSGTEGAALGDAGQSTATNLEQYYNTLADQAMDILEFDAFNAGTSPRPPLTAPQVEEMFKTITALQTRARVAHSLGSLYGGLKNLSTDKSGDAAQASATELGKSLQGLVPLPHNIDPSTLFGSIAKDLVEARQARDIRRSVQQGLLIQSNLDTLFQRETQAYKSISEERYEVGGVALLYLMDKNKAYVDMLPLISSIPVLLGLSLSNSGAALADDKVIAGAVNVARVRLLRQQVLSGGLTDATEHSLALLAQQDQQFLDHRKANLSDLTSTLARAQSYADELNTLSKQAKGGAS